MALVWADVVAGVVEAVVTGVVEAVVTGVVSTVAADVISTVVAGVVEAGVVSTVVAGVVSTASDVTLYWVVVNVCSVVYEVLDTLVTHCAPEQEVTVTRLVVGYEVVMTEVLL